MDLVFVLKWAKNPAGCLLYIFHLWIFTIRNAHLLNFNRQSYWIQTSQTKGQPYNHNFPHKVSEHSLLVRRYRAQCWTPSCSAVAGWGLLLEEDGDLWQLVPDVSRAEAVRGRRHPDPGREKAAKVDPVSGVEQLRDREQVVLWRGTPGPEHFRICLLYDRVRWRAGDLNP